jgi:hypothetical protein
MFAPQKPGIIFMAGKQAVNNSRKQDIKGRRSGRNAWSSGVDIFYR